MPEPRGRSATSAGRRQAQPNRRPAKSQRATLRLRGARRPRAQDSRQEGGSTEPRHLAHGTIASPDHVSGHGQDGRPQKWRARCAPPAHPPARSALRLAGAPRARARQDPDGIGAAATRAARRSATAGGFCLSISPAAPGLSLGVTGPRVEISHCHGYRALQIPI